MDEDKNIEQNDENTTNTDVQSVEQNSETTDNSEVFQKEIEKLKDSNARLLAEIINTRKNFDLDKNKSKQSLLLKIISIVNTYSIIAENDNSENPEVISLKNILQELETLLATEGIKKQDIKIGDSFDPNTSEVISTAIGEEDGKIVAVISPAYSLSNQIIKTAKVIVSKKS